MNLALTELRRRPSRFVTATLILTLLSVLLMLLGGLLDGLTNNSVGAITAQRAEIITYSREAGVILTRSRIDPSTRASIEGVDGVDRIGGLGQTTIGARIDDAGPRDLVGVALFGFEIPPVGITEVPADGEAIADDSLREQGAEIGSVLRLGPNETPLKVTGFISDSNFQNNASVWASLDTWRQVTAENRPRAAVGQDVSQAITVMGDGTVPVAELIDRIDAATNGTTASFTPEGSVLENDAVQGQQGTFNQIIGVTVTIAVVVVALFFALLTVERTGLYGVLKAIGARSSTLFIGVVAQAIVVTLIASAIGSAIAVVLDVTLPPGVIPYQLGLSRVLFSVVALLFASVVGCAFSLRRVLRIDPASAIGTAL